MSYKQLPKGYKFIKNINVEKSKKKILFFNLGSSIIFITIIALGLFIFSMAYFINIIKIIRFHIIIQSVLVILFMFILSFPHELIHGVFMKMYTGAEVRFGKSSAGYYTLCNGYLQKKHYIITVLSPVAFIGIILLMINLLVPIEWAWVIYFMQAFNLGSAISDYYLSYTVAKLPKDVLIYQNEISLILYSYDM